MTVPHAAQVNEIETASGRYFDLAAPDPRDVDLYDIAHALGNICRFNGHCRVFYSVAEHAVRVADKLITEGCEAWALAGLHHDDAEAYLGDIPRPIKPLLGDIYTKMTVEVDAAIHEALGRLWFVADMHSPQVKTADNWMLAVEARSIMQSRGEGWGGIGDVRWPVESMSLGLSPEQARALFIRRHRELVDRSLPSSERGAR